MQFKVPAGVIRKVNPIQRIERNEVTESDLNAAIGGIQYKELKDCIGFAGSSRGVGESNTKN